MLVSIAVIKCTLCGKDIVGITYSDGLLNNAGFSGIVEASSVCCVCPTNHFLNKAGVEIGYPKLLNQPAAVSQLVFDMFGQPTSL